MITPDEDVIIFENVCELNYYNRKYIRAYMFIYFYV